MAAAVKKTKDGIARAQAASVRDELTAHEDRCLKAYKQLHDGVEELSSNVNALKTSNAAVILQVKGMDDDVKAGKEILRKLEQALLGNEFEDRPGILARVRKLEEALHGKDGEPSIFLRRDQLWRYAALVIGASAAGAGGIGAGANGLIKLILGGGS